MSSTTESATRAAHNRWHVNKNIQRASCVHCQAAAIAAGKPLAPSPEETTSIRRAEKRLAISTKLVEFDATASSLAARQRTLQEAATIFDMDVAQFEEEIQNAFGITWEELASRKSIVLFDEIESAIWREARGGDIRFISLLISLGKLPGWNEAQPPQQPMRQLSAGSHEILPQEDLRTLSLEELQRKRLLLETKRLKDVIDRPTTSERLSTLQTPTLEVQDVTELPEGWTKAPDGTVIAVGAEETYACAQKERRG
jgi:hypothetical protein